MIYLETNSGQTYFDGKNFVLEQKRESMLGLHYQ
jgi:hypothetical protein